MAKRWRDYIDLAENEEELRMLEEEIRGSYLSAFQRRRVAEVIRAKRDRWRLGLGEEEGEDAGR